MYEFNYETGEPSGRPPSNVLVYADENARSTKKVKRALAMGIEGMTVERFASLYLNAQETSS